MKWFGIGLRERRGLTDRGFTGSVVSEGAMPDDEVLGAAVREVKRVLRFRRWNAQQEEPFNGFGSQPGKF